MFPCMYVCMYIHTYFGYMQRQLIIVSSSISRLTCSFLINENRILVTKDGGRAICRGVKARSHEVSLVEMGETTGAKGAASQARRIYCSNLFTSNLARQSGSFITFIERTYAPTYVCTYIHTPLHCCLSVCPRTPEFYFQGGVKHRLENLPLVFFCTIILLGGTPAPERATDSICCSWPTEGR
jgi:hypothetical protein